MLERLFRAKRSSLFGLFANDKDKKFFNIATRSEVDRWTGISSPPKGIISVSKNDGRYKREIVGGQLDNPTSIALDPEHGLMFWTDAGDKPKIESAW